MTLAEYLKEREMTATDLAEELGVHFGTVYHWLKGDTRPNKTQMANLIALTEGKVTPNDFYNGSEE